MKLAAVSLALLLLGPSSSEAPDSGFAFVGVNVVPLDGERLLLDHTVIVREDRIVALGPRESTALPAGVHLIESDGYYLMPGLVDMHVHLWGDRQARWLVANGVTSVRNMSGAPMHLRPRDPSFAATFVGPTIYTTGPIIDGDPPVWEGSALLTEPARATELVLEQKAAGYDAIKVYVRMSAPAYEALMAAAAEHDMPVVGHVPMAVGLERALELGQRSIEHLNGYGPAVRRREIPSTSNYARDNIVSWADIDEERFAEIVRRTAEAGTWNVPTLVTRERARLTAAGLSEVLALEEMRRVAPEVIEQWVERATAAPPVAEISEHTRGQRLRMVKALFDAGAGLLIGTDAGNPWALHGFAIHDELDFFLEAGLTPYQALHSATAAAATFLHEQEELGTVSVGRRADLLLVAGNPLKDVKHVRQPVGVMLRGTWYTAEDLEEMLDWTPAQR